MSALLKSLFSFIDQIQILVTVLSKGTRQRDVEVNLASN